MGARTCGCWHAESGRNTNASDLIRFLPASRTLRWQVLWQFVKFSLNAWLTRLLAALQLA